MFKNIDVYSKYENIPEDYMEKITYTGPCPAADFTVAKKYIKETFEDGVPPVTDSQYIVDFSINMFSNIELMPEPTDPEHYKILRLKMSENFELPLFKKTLVNILTILDDMGE
jgi:hypothetical protein